jgi:drug/metabolite transporter (DMT)-like permease
LLNRGGNLLQEYHNLNWSSFLLGLAVVGLEAGSVYMYKAGWNVSSGQLVYSILLSVCLILVGVFAYHESIGITKIIGILVCMVGLFLISR